MKEKEGVKIDKKKTPHTDFIAARGTGIIKVPGEIVYQVVRRSSML